MKTYRVTVRVQMLEFYEVRARNKEEALEYWAEGRFLGCDDETLATEPVKAVEALRQ